MADTQKYVKQFESFMDVTDGAREASGRDEDYVHHKQWTAEEVEELESRNQPAVVINRVKTKVNLLNGLQRQRRTDPKALPRTPRDEGGADAITDALRYVADNVDFDQTSSESFNDMLVAYGAAITEVGDNNGEIEIQINRIAWDRFYFDPHSREKDFSDAKYMGIVIWMDAEDAEIEFPDKKDEIDGLVSGANDSIDGTTFDDRPLWIDRKRKRIRVCQHYVKEKGVWMVAYFSDQVFLIEPKESNYVDEFGNPDCPIEAQALYIDRDNNRYGEVRSYIDPQDEINHRRSKLLYMLSVRQTMGEEGSVDDVDAMKAELAKSDGHVKYNPGTQFELLNTNDLAAGHIELYRESRADIDSIGANAELSGDASSGSSGRAIQALQQGSMAEVAVIYDAHKSWERRIYRQAYNRIKQFWDGEKWIRITDNEDSLKWVGLNQQVTKGQFLQELAEQGQELAIDALEQAGEDPRLNEVHEVRNNTSEIDVDIVLTESPDYATLKHEQFETLASLAQVYGPEKVPFEVMLELSDMGHKKSVKDLLEGDEDPEQLQAATQLASMQAEKAMEGLELDNAKKRSEIGKNVTDIEQKQVETERLRNEPLGSVNVSV